MITVLENGNVNIGWDQTWIVKLGNSLSVTQPRNRIGHSVDLRSRISVHDRRAFISSMEMYGRDAKGNRL